MKYLLLLILLFAFSRRVNKSTLHCGLFGVYSPNPIGYLEVANTMKLGMLSQFRGEHSTGLAMVKRKNGGSKLSFHTKRAPLPSGIFLNLPETKQFIWERNMMPLVIMGHTRLATSGLINENNAHPIQEGRITACHNGTIDAFEPEKQEEATNTDSRVFIKRIAEKGIAQAIADALDGSYALTYLDQAARTLHFIRNSKRPLFYMWNHGKTHFYWSSEREILDFVRWRDGTGAFGEPGNFTPGVLYTFKLGSTELKQHELEIPRPLAQTELARRIMEAQRRKSEEDGGKKTTLLYNISFCPDCKKRKDLCTCNMGLFRAAREAIIHLPAPKETSVPKTGTSGGHLIYPYKNRDMRPYRYYNNVIASVDSVSLYLEEGCQTCATPLKPEDSVHWTSYESCICSKCLTDPQVWHYAVHKGTSLFKGQLQDWEKDDTNH